MLSYPITWTLTAAVNGFYLYYLCRQLFQQGRSAVVPALAGGR